MTTLQKKKMSATLLEDAVEAIQSSALNTIRWDGRYYDAQAEFDRYDDEQLLDHLNPDGHELMDLARQLIAIIEEL